MIRGKKIGMKIILKFNATIFTPATSGASERALFTSCTPSKVGKSWKFEIVTYSLNLVEPHLIRLCQRRWRKQFIKSTILPPPSLSHSHCLAFSFSIFFISLFCFCLTLFPTHTLSLLFTLTFYPHWLFCTSSVQWFTDHILGCTGRYIYLFNCIFYSCMYSTNTWK